MAGKGHLGLDLFFVISGFVIPYALWQNNYSWRQFPQFLLKRSIRIEIPYIASFSIYLLFTYFECKAQGIHFTVNYVQYFLHFLYLQEYLGYIPYSSVYWTLAIEFQFYILVGCLFPLIIHKNRVIQIGLLVLFGILSYFLILHYNWFIFQYGFLFLAGIIVFLYHIKNISAKVFIPLLALLLILVYIKNGLDVSIVVAFAACTILFLKKEWKLTWFLGNTSFSLYLTHITAAGTFIIYAKSIIPNEILLRFASIGFALIYATLFYYLIERPAFKLSKKIRYYRKPQTADR